METEMVFKVETGLQLVTRLILRPCLKNLHPLLFQEGPEPNDVIEIYDEENTGKTSLLLDIIATATMPEEYGGKSAHVILFITDGNFNFTFLPQIINQRIKLSLGNNWSSTQDIKTLEKKLLDHVLKRITLYEIFDSFQLGMSIHNLEKIFSTNSNISLLIVDTLTAFYWSEQSAKITKLDTYLKNLNRNISKVCKEHKITYIYTRPEYFTTKTINGSEKLEPCVKEQTVDKINYRIGLNRTSADGNSEYDMIFQASISNCSGMILRRYKLNENTFEWILIGLFPYKRGQKEQTKHLREFYTDYAFKLCPNSDILSRLEGS